MSRAISIGSAHGNEHDQITSGMDDSMKPGLPPSIRFKQRRPPARTEADRAASVMQSPYLDAKPYQSVLQLAAPTSSL